MEPPSPEDVAEVAAGLRRASLDLVERPWSGEGDGIPLKEKRKHKKHKHRKHKAAKGDPARSALVIQQDDSDDDGALKHHRHHHERHVHPKDDSEEEEYGSDLSYDSYGSSEEDVAEKKNRRVN